jgi:hypothetical protein
VPVRGVQAESEEDGRVEGTEPGPQEQLGGWLTAWNWNIEKRNTEPNTRYHDVAAVYTTKRGAASGPAGMIIPHFC